MKSLKMFVLVGAVGLAPAVQARAQDATVVCEDHSAADCPVNKKCKNGSALGRCGVSGSSCSCVVPTQMAPTSVVSVFVYGLLVSAAGLLASAHFLRTESK